MPKTTLLPFDRGALRRLARRCGLRIAARAELTIRRRKAGKGFSFHDAEGGLVTDPEIRSRLLGLAVPPAYRDVRYAPDPRAHLQAIGEDAAGRLQYRYHPDWTRVREELKALRLACLAQSLPAIRRSVRRALGRPEPDRRLALASVVQLVALTAIRAGGEQYAEERGTRGATTLLKSHLRIEGERITLRFKGKGGKLVEKEARDAALAAALLRLKALPGRRLFLHRDAGGGVHALRAGEVNAYLREIGGAGISLKDFRTLTACLGVIDGLSHVVPDTSERGLRQQIKTAVEPLAEQLANTVTVCRSSYVHDAVIAAFASGRLARLAGGADARRSLAARTALLAQLLQESTGAPPPATKPARNRRRRTEPISPAAVHPT
ncbi:DNA topoisomerase IB [Ancylobacter oerskovii]|uniref:DNA topoisomerase IB n=1 Tax=Ancylobacter oerskovii TaxID=459519 RepID=A0ABW4Z2D0_9HYPH|nr:DNA topoisomerase IB [Ancylobacter oerskovii]MBS7544742.1 DNA topoisomerase IB [Ancylobacter oerskovii]